MAVLCVVAATSAFAAQQSPPSAAAPPCEDGLPHFHTWFNSTKLSSGQTYVAEAKRKERVLDNYPKLHLQMTLPEVKQLLGRPDFSAPRASGHPSNDPHPAPTVCSDLIAYIFKKTSQKMADTSDEAVYLFFSPDGKLTWAAPQNLPSLQKLGGPR